MKLLILLALGFALHAEDVPPLATVEQLQAKVAEQQKESVAKDQTIAKLQARLNVWVQSAVFCEAKPRIDQLNQQVDAQIDAQAKAAKQEKAK